jgi:hypothetical protein
MCQHPTDDTSWVGPTTLPYPLHFSLWQHSSAMETKTNHATALPSCPATPPRSATVPSHVPASPTPHRRRGPSATTFIGTRRRDPIGYRRRATRSIFGCDHSSMILPHVVDFEIGIPSYSPRASRQISQERSHGRRQRGRGPWLDSPHGRGLPRRRGEGRGSRCRWRMRWGVVDGELLDFCYILSCDDAIIAYIFC